MDLLKALIIVSEKAANVARICRQNDHLFQLLVQQKKTDEANPRFVDDFKTLADVLIQEMVKHDIGQKFPDLQGHIRGEENNKFSNKLGESICVEVKQTEDETSKLLQTVLNGDKQAADLLAEEVHREIKIENVKTVLPNKNNKIEMDINDLGVWIDPIDCTAEYINGSESVYNYGICISGLQCATVLLGVYSRKSSVPVIGIVNQPFVKKESEAWTGQCYWGVCFNTTTISSVQPANTLTKIISLSSSENNDVKSKLEQNGYKLLEASGAGYKILTVITGLVDAYILSKNTTFKWDTCAPHAILRSIGGNIIVYEAALQNNPNAIVKYPNNGDNSNDCNLGGIIAFKSQEVLNEIVDILK